MDYSLPMDFYCMTCNTCFEKQLFNVARSMERVLFFAAPRLNEVQVTHAEGIGVFCSDSCRAQGLPALMARERVPIPVNPPDIGPIEVCARCSGPVDMSDFHLTYSKCEMVYSGIYGRESNFKYLAVVCQRCAGSHAAVAEPVANRVSADITL